MSTNVVSEDWSKFNDAVRRRAGQVPSDGAWKRPAALAAAATAAAGLALAIALWPEPAESVVPAEPVVASTPPLRIDPADLDRLTLRIHPDDLARLRTGGNGGGGTAPSIAPPSFPNVPPPPPQAPISPGGPPAKVVTNFTVFHRVDIGEGMGVWTGWRYASSGDDRPSYQFCYLAIPDGDGADRMIKIANSQNGRVANSATFDEVFGRCVWFEGTLPSAASPPPAGRPAPAPSASSSPPAPAATPALPASSANFGPSFWDGFRDRLDWERWFASLVQPRRSGAEWWAGQRSTPRPQSCETVADPVAVDGCREAQRRLAPTDARRRSEPEYRRGWNAERDETGDLVPFGHVLCPGKGWCEREQPISPPPPSADGSAAAQRT